MPRLRIQVLAALLAGLIAGAHPLDAQQSGEARTYTVKAGDSLWSIAKAMLGDPYLWAELYRLNVGAIADPHWIYPGTTLKLSGAAAKEAAPAPGAEAQPAAEHGAPSGMRRANETRTIFDPAARKTAQRSRESLIIGARSTAVRPGDFIASPFVWAAGGLVDSGLLEWTAEKQGIDMTIEQRPIQPSEDIVVRLPAGVAGAAGSRLLVYREGPMLAGQGQVMVPTGIVRLTRPAGAGRAEATLVQKFEDVFIGQRVASYDTLVSRPGVFPARVEFGAVSSIAWIFGDPVMPAPGHFLILRASAAEGLVSGDQVSLMADAGTDESGRQLADIEVGVAQITRVTRWGASAVLIKQTGPSIAVGMKVRVTAKMP